MGGVGAGSRADTQYVHLQQFVQRNIYIQRREPAHFGACGRTTGASHNREGGAGGWRARPHAGSPIAWATRWVAPARARHDAQVPTRARALSHPSGSGTTRSMHRARFFAAVTVLGSVACGDPSPKVPALAAPHPFPGGAASLATAEPAAGNNKPPLPAAPECAATLVTRSVVDRLGRRASDWTRVGTVVVRMKDRRPTHFDVKDREGAIVSRQDAPETAPAFRDAVRAEVCRVGGVSVVAEAEAPRTAPMRSAFGNRQARASRPIWTTYARGLPKASGKGSSQPSSVSSRSRPTR